MGGPGSGGSRVNSGPASKSSKLRWLSGNAGHRTRTELDEKQVSEPMVTGEVPEPPETLRGEGKTHWRKWAPQAHASGMLNERTLGGFELLCRTAAEADEFLEVIREQGLTYKKVTVDGAGQQQEEIKAHPILSHYRGHLHRMEQLMARYGLAADGKVRVEKPETQDDEREALAKLLAVK